MQITLRQAHNLINKINTKLATIKLSATATVSAWDSNQEDVFAAARAATTAQLDLQLKLLEVRHGIRGAIQATNHTSGVNELVAKRKHALDVISTLRHLVESVDAQAISTQQGLTLKVEAMRASDNRYGRDEVTIAALSTDEAEEMETKIATLQLELEGIEDQLARVNSTAMISLDNDAAAVLRQHRII